MKAILFDQPGDESVLHLADVPAPRELPPDHLHLRARAAGVNRADLLQRQGKYPPPPGASPILGLEAAGSVRACGSDVTRFRPGDRVMALLAGGGYAEEIIVHAGSVLPVPAALSDDEAGGFMETYVTAFLNLFLLGGAASGQNVLVHGGGSGVGTAALALLREAGVTAYVTAGGAERCGRCTSLGAAAAFDHETEDFVEAVRAATGGRGVDIVLDHIGATYFGANLRCLAPDGRLVAIGSFGGGRTAELDYGLLLSRRLRIFGSTLRALDAERKAVIVGAFAARFGPALAAGRLKPILHAVFPLTDAAAAHRAMARERPFGKIVLRLAE